MLFKKTLVTKASLVFADFAALLLSLLFAVVSIKLASHFSSVVVTAGSINKQLIIYLLLAIGYVGCIYAKYRHYTYRKPFWSEYRKVIKTTCFFAILQLAINAFWQLPFSRGLWLLSWLATL